MKIKLPNRQFRFETTGLSDNEIYEKYKNVYLKELNTEIVKLYERNWELVSKLPLSAQLHTSLFMNKVKTLEHLETVLVNIHTRTFIDYIFTVPFDFIDVIIGYLEFNFEDVDYVEYNSQMCEVNVASRELLQERKNKMQSLFDRVKDDIEATIHNPTEIRDTMIAFDRVYDEFIDYIYPF